MDSKHHHLKHSLPCPEFHIRELQQPEIPQLKALYKENLWLLDRLIFSGVSNSVIKEQAQKTATCLVAVEGAQIIGSFCVRWMEIKGERHGLIDAVVTAKERYGQGIAKKLLLAAVEWLESQDCHHIYATADRYNSRSWNMFIHHGFSLYEVPQQMRDFGWSFFKVWGKEHYFFGLGNFFLKKNLSAPRYPESSPLYHLFLGAAGLILPWFILALMGGATLNLLPYLALVIGASLVFHEYSHWLVARCFRLSTTFKANEPGILFSLLLALIGGIYPCYGSTYIREQDWSYVRQTKINGMIYSVGPVMTIALALLCSYLASFTQGDWSTALSVATTMNVTVALVNLIPITASGGFPWDGVKIYRWNKLWWLVILVGVILIRVFLL